MADTKISALDAIASIVAADLYAVIDDPGGTPASKKATHTQLLAFIESSITVTTSMFADFEGDVAGTTAVTANTAKVTNATHTGDVTGSGELTIASGAVEAGMMAANSIDSASYVDGSIDPEHLAAATKTISFIIPCSDEKTTEISTGTAVATFRMPFAFTLTGVRASLQTASTSGAVTIDINESGTTVLSTEITIDQDEKTSEDATTPPVIDDSDLDDDAEMTVDIDGAGTGAKGLKVTLIGFKA